MSTIVEHTNLEVTIPNGRPAQAEIDQHGYITATFADGQRRKVGRVVMALQGMTEIDHPGYIALLPTWSRNTKRTDRWFKTQAAAIRHLVRTYR